MSSKYAKHIVLILLSSIFVLSINQTDAWNIAPVPRSYYYDWVPHSTETIASGVDVVGKPLYLQFLVKPDVEGKEVATYSAKTYTSAKIGVELGISTTLEATVKELAAKSTAKVLGGVKLESDATISTELTEKYEISVTHLSDCEGKFTARFYTLRVNVYVRHYYLHKFVWDWHTRAYYDTGRTTEQKPYHKIEYGIEITDLKDVVTKVGVKIDKYPNSAGVICNDIIKNHKYITAEDNYCVGPYDPDAGETPSSVGIGVCSQYSYTFSSSFYIEAELGEGIKISGNKLEVKVKCSAKTSVTYNQQYSEMIATYFEYWGTTEEVWFHLYTLAWNGCWVKRIEK